FVLRHRKKGNLVIHFFSFLTYYASLFALIVTWHPAWILGLFLSGFIGTAGHYIFDDGRVKIKEATFDPMVVFYVTIMFYKIFRRSYSQDIESAEQRLKQWQLSEAPIKQIA
ncbi:MAG: hypothetical protein P1V97_29240, partial [Planctomycetota bacterium]|nr:hypothetical protein [Planctomycetota bacterium]